MASGNTNSFVLPSSPADLKKIRQILDEGVNCRIRIDAEKEAEKAIKERLLEEFEIPKKIAGQLIATMHKHNYSEVSAEQEEFQVAYEKITSA